MKFRTLIRRSLRYHWRSHLGVVVGAVIGSAALIGALIVGDSVRGSLRERALERLGEIHFVLEGGDRFFTQRLGDYMSRDPMDLWREDHTVAYFRGGPAAALTLPAVGAKQDGSATANRVQLIGPWQWPLHDRANHYYDFWSYARGWDGAGPTIKPGEVWLNQPLAAQLKAGVGDELIFRVHKPGVLSSDAPIAAGADNSVALRLRVAGIVTSGQLGLYSPRSGAVPPLNAFVNLEEFQDAVDLAGRANLLVAGGVVEEDEHLKDLAADAANKVAGLNAARQVASLLDSSGRFRDATLAQRNYQEELADTVSLDDYEAALRKTSDGQQLELTSRRIFLDEPMVQAAFSTKPDSVHVPVGSGRYPRDAVPAPITTNGIRILTYLANLITDGTNEAPYSMVTAAGSPWTPTDLRDDEIVINQWLADDLQAMPGDELTLVYFDPESGARLEERTNTFRVHSIVPMRMPWCDRTLMPQFPGIEKAETTAEWDTAFPLVHKIRPQDDDYWTEYRGTPKAFVTLAAGQKMWANRFGSLTAIRFPIPMNLASLRSEQKANSVERFSAALERKILATLKPEELGLRFEPVREQALKAAEQSQDFGGLFIGFSLFVIVAALVLMALLFRFGLEQRVTEIGTLLALGLTPKQVRRLFLREGVVLAFIGGGLGAVAGIGYAKAMLLGLTTLWSDAVGTNALHFFVTTQTLLIGLFASVMVAVLTLWLALRRQVKRPARELLAGQVGRTTMEGGGARWRTFTGSAALLVALGLVGWTLAKGDTANAGVFFGAGALVLISGLCFLSARLMPRSAYYAGLSQISSRQLAARSLGRRRSRSVATAAMLASGTFLIVSIGVFRLDANRDATLRSSGTGGFALIGESTMPVAADLNTKAGRESFALNESDFAGVNVVPFRVHQGDEASCLNLNRAQTPRLLGVKPESLLGRFTFTKNLNEMTKVGPWSALTRSHLTLPLEENEIPAIGDANSVQWAMGKKVGETLEYVDERGRTFKVCIVGAVANSILQGQLIIDEAEFVKRFPSESGYRYFLIDAPPNRVANLSEKLSRALQDSGLQLTPAPARLNEFNAVQNTYLGTFQVLGGLGLLLGSAGLGIVVLRNVLERRGELAVLLAVGWRQSAVSKLLLLEHVALLGAGLLIGLVAAVVAVLPGLLGVGRIPYLSLSLTLLLVVANGVVFTWIATRFALRGDLLAALRNE